MKNFFALIFTFFTLIFLGQNDTLPEVQIEASQINSPSKTYKTIELPISNSGDLSAVLKKNSSLYLKSYGIGSLTSVSIRGANASQTQLVWNGFTINSPTLGQNDLAISSVTLVDNVALHLGASSLVNSSGGLGGAIQMTNKADFTKGVNLFVSKEMGSFGIDNTLLKVKIGNHKWQSFSGISKKHADNDFKYRNFLKKEPSFVRQQNSKSDQIEFSQNVYYNHSLKHQLSLKSNFVASQRYLPSIMGVKTRGEHQEDKALKSMLDWSYKSNKYFQQIAVGYFFDYLNYIDTASAIDSKVSTNAIKYYYKGKYYITDNIHLKGSVNISKVEAKSTGFENDKNQFRNSIFLEYQQSIKEKLSYTLAFRKEIITNISTPVIPSVAFKWNKWKSSKVFASAAKNYRTPTFNDLYWSPGGNVDLLPEDGLISELGFENKNKLIDFEITGYYSLINNWIQWLPSEKGYWQPQNIKEVESKGIEFSISKKIKIKKVKINLKSNYNLVLSTNKSTIVNNDASVGKQLIYVPKNVANIHLGFTYKKISLQYFQTYNGSIFIDASNQTYMPYFAPASLNLNWQLTKNKAKNTTNLGIKIENIYNEEYQIMANRPMPGRYFMFVLKIESKR